MVEERACLIKDLIKLSQLILDVNQSSPLKHEAQLKFNSFLEDRTSGKPRSIRDLSCPWLQGPNSLGRNLGICIKGHLK